MLIRQVERYVDYRHKLGVGFEEGEHTLTLFARYADEHGDSHVTIERIHEWCSQACSPERARAKYNLLRRFSLFLRAEDPGHAAPPIGAFGCRRRPRPAPHLLQPEQIAAIISAALTYRTERSAPAPITTCSACWPSQACGCQRHSLCSDPTSPVMGCLFAEARAAEVGCCRSTRQHGTRSGHISTGATGRFLSAMIFSSSAQGELRTGRPSAKCLSIWPANSAFVARSARPARACTISGTVSPSDRLRPASTITTRCAVTWRPFATIWVIAVFCTPIGISKPPRS